MVDGAVTTAFDASVNPGSEVALNLSRPFPRFRHPRIEIVYEDDNIVVTETTSAADIEDWDSLTHITLISSVEEEFDIKFSMKDVIGMKNVGEMVDIIMEDKE